MATVPPEDEKVSDEKLARLASAYGKMSFETSYREIASIFRELQALRARQPDREAVIEECARKALDHEGPLTPAAFWEAIRSLKLPALSDTTREKA